MKMARTRYCARLATSEADLTAAQTLRHRCFMADEADQTGRDADGFDATCQHVLVEERGSNRLVATFRFLPLRSGADIHQTYSAQFYALDALRKFEKPMAEMGRFCIHPDVRDPDVLRVAWAEMTRYVDTQGVEMLFGCSSFQGTDHEAYADAFAMLKERHLAPKRWLPRIKAPNVFRFAQRLRRSPDHKRALKTMPPLLRSYLTMGGWVSDHAVVDRDLNTLHVFTGLEVRAIPPARLASLRALPG